MFSGVAFTSAATEVGALLLRQLLNSGVGGGTIDGVVVVVAELLAKLGGGDLKYDDDEAPAAPCWNAVGDVDTDVDDVPDDIKRWWPCSNASCAN